MIKTFPPATRARVRLQQSSCIGKIDCRALRHAADASSRTMRSAVTVYVTITSALARAGGVATAMPVSALDTSRSSSRWMRSLPSVSIRLGSTATSCLAPLLGSSALGLAALLDYAREGDAIVVIGIDRLGRNAAEVMTTI